MDCAKLVEIGPMVLKKKIFKFRQCISLFRNYLPLEKGWALHLNKLESPSPKDALCQVWLKLAQWFWRRNFFNFLNVFSLFRNYLPLVNGGALHLNKLAFPSPKDGLCQVWLKLAQWFWRRRFLNFVNVFSLFRNYLPLEKLGPFFWTNLNYLHQRMLCAKFGLNWPSGSEEEDF